MFNKTEILKFIRKWFRCINNHSNVEQLLDMLTSGDFEMIFPEATLKTADDFRKWYLDVTSKYFDQRHDLKNFEIMINENECDIYIYLNWRAHTWRSPDPFSSFLDYDALQRWKVVLDDQGNLKIKQYVVEMLEDNKEGLKGDIG